MSDFEVNDAYDCDVPTLHRILTAADYLQAKFPAIGFRDVQVFAAELGKVEVQRTVTAPLPGFARRILGDEQVITQVEYWAAGNPDVTGTFTADAKGTPVHIDGTLRIAPAGSGSMLTIRGKAECKVPLVGGKIAGLAATEARRTLERERDFTRSWVAAHT